MNLKQIGPGVAPANRGDGGAAPLRSDGSAATGRSAPASAPAVSVQVSAAASAPLQTANSPELSDTALLDELRTRLRQGNFQIDYGRLSQSLVEDAVAAIGSGGVLPRR